MAGKPKGKEPLTHPLNFRITERHATALQKRGEKESKFDRDVARDAIEAYLFPKKKKGV